MIFECLNDRFAMIHGVAVGLSSCVTRYDDDCNTLLLPKTAAVVVSVGTASCGVIVKVSSIYLHVGKECILRILNDLVILSHPKTTPMKSKFESFCTNSAFLIIYFYR